MILQELLAITQQNGLDLSDDHVLALDDFASRLSQWNSKINLISRNDEAHIFDRHILHSLTLAMPALCDYDFQNQRALDIGTGGGLPGIPLKIAIRSLDITLIDSTQKKIAAVSDMISELGIPGIRAIAARAEELAKFPAHARAYDVIVSRAVAPLEDLIQWSRGLLKPNGVLFSLKGGDLSEEIERANRLKGIGSITVRPLDLKGYSEFLHEEKKLVRADFAG
jgi:16S rRNA (guanine527-N7)-methyltransferase